MAFRIVDSLIVGGLIFSISMVSYTYASPNMPNSRISDPNSSQVSNSEHNTLKPLEKDSLSIEERKKVLAEVPAYLMEITYQHAKFYGYTEIHNLDGKVVYHSYNADLKIGATWEEELVASEEDREPTTVFKNARIYQALELTPIGIEVEEGALAATFANADYLKEGDGYLQTSPQDGLSYRINFGVDVLLGLEIYDQENTPVSTITYELGSHPNLASVIAELIADAAVG